MSTVRLNLNALRKRKPQSFFADPLGTLASADDGGFKASRRQVLKSAAIAAAAMTPRALSAKSAVAPALRGAFALKEDGQALHFMLGQKICWTIDPAHFSGDPTLTFDRSDEHLLIRLRNALYPGTQIPADLTLLIRTRLTDCSMKLTMAFGKFKSEGSLENWLAGAAPFKSDVQLAHEIQTSSAGTVLKLGGTARAKFFPTWTFQLNGTSIAMLHGIGEALRSDDVKIALRTSDDSHAISDSASGGHSTHFTLQKGSANWSIEHGIESERHWKLDLQNECLDQVRFEAFDHESGPVHAIVAEQTANTVGAALRLHAIKAIAGESFVLPLKGARMAILYNALGEERAFTAQYDETATWLHTNGCSLLVGAPKAVSNEPIESAPFEVYSRNGILEHMHCEPALLKIAVPMSGALVDVSDVPEGTRLAITTVKESREHKIENPFLASLALHDNGDENAILRFPANFVIGVVRPDDLLVLKFEFINMEFKSEGKDGLRLTKKAGKDGLGSYLVVHFPPQNIAEQVFFLTTDVPFAEPSSASLGLSPKSGYKPDTSGNETPAPPPVQARAASPSRLAFYIPAEVDFISYSLKALLDWTRLVPSLVPVAFPPPPPPWTIYYLPVGSFKQAKLISRDVGSNFKYNGTKLSRAQLNVQLAGATQKPTPQILTDVRHSPKFTVTTNQSLKQQAISNIQQHTKVSLSSDSLSSIGDLISQTIPGSKVILIPGLLDLTLRPPHLYETALETPYRLILSPNQFAGWAHRADLLTETDAKGIAWTELWHTRLGVKRTDSDNNITIDEQDDYYRTLRAVWSPDYNPNDGPDFAQNPKHFPADDPFFRMSLDRRDRHELVELTAGFAIPNLPDTDKRVIRAERLMLSSQGAWMNTRGAWDVPFVAAKPLSLEEWRHRSAMGRDNYVRVVYKGFLFPFGHRASLIKVTERRFEWQPGGYNIAYLRQRMFIVVRQPLKQYPADFQPNGGRKLPFQSVEITTLVTPNIKKPDTEAIYPGDPQTAFWPHIAADDPGQSFRFHCIGTDWEGRRIEFVAPLAFIDNTRAYTFGSGSAIDLAVSKYAKDTAKSLIAFSGQKIAYADARKAGDTTFETTTITFGAEKPDPSTTSTQLGSYDQPGFYPTLESAALHIEAVKQIVAMGGPTPMKYHTSFVQKAWDGLHNPGQVFLQVIGEPIGLGFGGSGGASTDKVGGLVTPSMAISGLSRLSGPLSGNIDVPDALPDPSTLPAALKGVFDPKDFFGKLDPSSIQLLGGLSLMDILKLVGGAAADASGLKDAMEANLKDLVNNAANQITTEVIDALPKSPIPAYITQMIYDAEAAASQVQNALKIPKQIQILFKWNPTVQEFGPFKIDGAPDSILSLSALLVIPINAPVIPTPDPSKGLPDPSTFKAPSLGTPVYTVLAKLQTFTLDLFGVIAIKFNSVTFKMESGKKADINADIEDVSFEGPLAFVNDLEKVIPSDGFSDPPSIEVTPTGVKIGFDLALPTISVGAFSLSHVALGASLNLPFTGAPLRFRFHFCTRENPFLLTIYCFGGGGFFAIELGLDGLETLEASFEFGAAVALDFGVASGSVSIMAGIYFKLTKTATGDECLITGYVRVNGNLDVCGIISVSIELYLEISYDSGPPKKCWGEATLTIKVSVLFFSIGFSTTMRKEFVDPALQLKDYMVADDWAAYHLAFADNFQVQQ